MDRHAAVAFATLGVLHFALTGQYCVTKSILIADDFPQARQVIRELLEGAGFTVCGEAVDGVDALEKVDELSPDLLILDVGMPRLNGIEVVAMLKDRLPQMPIVLFTLYDAVVRMAPPAGIAAIISKSDGGDELVACVKRLLAPAAASAAAPEPSPVPA